MRFATLLLLYGASFFSSCNFERSDAPSPDFCSTITYSKDVVPIIDLHCAIDGCHVAGFPQGDFTSYQELYSKVTAGSFQLGVFELMIMPPNDSLNDEELMTLQCWVNNGAPEN